MMQGQKGQNPIRLTVSPSLFHEIILTPIFLQNDSHEQLPDNYEDDNAHIHNTYVQRTINAHPKFIW